ncbi:MAG: DUF3108 domain-containing protein [Desulfatiglans sp.]|jgi:hypothetical protein|nr:DUF3108 domain-containing protein [Desulfatiglans sp.]
MTRFSPNPITSRQPRVGVFIVLIALVMVFSLSREVHAGPTRLPFAPGEKLIFQVRWAFIIAGEAVLEVVPIKPGHNKDSRHFAMTAKTSSFVDIFYKVRERIDAYTDGEMTHSILYKEEKSGRKSKKVVIRFDWDKMEAQYSRSGETRKPVALQPGSFDPLSVFYAFRFFDLETGKILRAWVTDGKKCVQGEAIVRKREKIKIPAGTFDTYLVEPDLDVFGGVFDKSKGAKLKIWVTADTRRLPVKIASKVVIGSFVAELVSGSKIGKIE